MTPSSPILCDACSTINPPDAAFCRKCEMPLARATTGCRLCGTRNPIDAKFCSYCGGNLTPTSHGLTSARAEAWWQHMNGFGFYANLWRERSIALKYHDRCLDLWATACDGIHFERIAFIAPIVNRDWCVARLMWQGRETTAGEILFTTDGLVLFDLAGRQGWQIPYQRLKHFGQNIWWEIDIGLENGEMLQLFVKRGGGRVALFRSADELLTDTRGQEIVDREGRLRRPPKYWDDAGAHKEGVGFWFQTMLFLLEVFAP